MSVTSTRRPRPAPAHATTVCWAVKGGSGTSVVAAALALATPAPTVLIDLAGDLPAVLGAPEPAGPGIHEWLASDAPADRLADLTTTVHDDLTLLPSGRIDQRASTDQASRWDELIGALSSDDHTVVVDAGTGVPPLALVDAADRSLLVTRACYLALRRAVAAPLRPDGIVLVAEHGRALRTTDVEAALGAPVIASIAIDPAVARAVDAGLLTARLPRMMQRDLRSVAA